MVSNGSNPAPTSLMVAVIKKTESILVWESGRMEYFLCLFISIGAILTDI